MKLINDHGKLAKKMHFFDKLGKIIQEINKNHKIMIMAGTIR